MNICKSLAFATIALTQFILPMSFNAWMQHKVYKICLYNCFIIYPTRWEIGVAVVTICTTLEDPTSLIASFDRRYLYLAFFFSLSSSKKIGTCWTCDNNVDECTLTNTSPPIHDDRTTTPQPRLPYLLRNQTAPRILFLQERGTKIMLSRHCNEGLVLHASLK